MMYPPLAKVDYKSEDVVVPKGDRQRRLHKALLRYHDPANWPMIRTALEEMGLQHLIGSRRECLVPAATIEEQREARRALRHHTPALTKHTAITRQRQPGSRSTTQKKKKKPQVASSTPVAKPSVSKTGARKSSANQTATGAKRKAKHH